MNKKVECSCGIDKLMRGVVPVVGNEYRKLMIVDLKAGEEIRPHKHKGHAVLYYPMDSSPITFEPQAGTVIYIPPGCRHWVNPVPVERMSFAMIVDDI